MKVEFKDHGYAICVGCNTIYDPTMFELYPLCPNMNCRDELFVADENIIPLLFELNNKGYTTKYSCSCHIFSNIYNLYIVFEDNIIISDQYLPNEFNISIENIAGSNKTTIRPSMETCDEFLLISDIGIKQKFIIDKIDILYKWSKSLDHNTTL